MESKPPHNRYFEREELTTPYNIKCYLVVPVIKLSAVVTRGNTDGTDKRIPAEYTWAMIEAAEWSKKQLHYEEIKVKGSSNKVKYASSPETYSVPEYYEYIPVQVKNAEPIFKQKFFVKHKGNNARLTLEMITCSFIMFKCNFDMVD